MLDTHAIFFQFAKQFVVGYTLKGDEFNRLADLDFSKFNDSKGAACFREKIDMPDGTRQFHENKLERTVDTFAKEFKVNAEECMLDFAMTLNPTDEEEIAALREGGPIVAYRCRANGVNVKVLPVPNSSSQFRHLSTFPPLNFSFAPHVPLW